MLERPVFYFWVFATSIVNRKTARAQGSSVPLPFTNTTSRLRNVFGAVELDGA